MQIATVLAPSLLLCGDRIRVLGLIVLHWWVHMKYLGT